MDEEEDDYVTFGTPLPELEDEIVLRKKAAKELEVRDEKGRQRFHGAFTGGFSAGYFNTVGTKEGWAPTTFISSRNKTADRVQQNPEDFMDEEDLGEFGIATRGIHTTSKFQDASVLNANKRKFAEVDSIIPGEAPLKDIVKPVRESIGIEILKKLGWKLGQGIGPRVKKQSGSAKVYGCSPFPDNTLPEEDDPLALSFTFAPKDTEAESYQPKDNTFGLGYIGLSKESILGAHIDTFNPTFTKSWLKKDKKKLTITGQAFGVGAFEEDDDDIYGKDDMSQYDFSDIEAKKFGQSSNKPGSSQFQAVGDTVLVGFCLASQLPPVKKYFPPPELPSNFRPISSMVPIVAVSAEPQFVSRHALSADDRSNLLGEKRFQPFQLTTIKKKDEKARKPDSPAKVNSPAFTNTVHSFRPFPNDEPKQKRYEEYLKLENEGGVEKLMQPSLMTEWEKQQEIEEFARAAVRFKPLSAALSSKFESRSHLSVEHEVMDALAKAKKESDAKTSVDKRKLIGISNRITSDWHPASLLCKRFNVPNPFPNSSEVSGSQKSKKLFDPSIVNRASRSSSFNSLEEKTPDTIIVKPPESESTSRNTATSSTMLHSNVEKKIQEPSSENKRPPIDFFKDIFENSSSDEEEPAQQAQLQTQASNSASKSPSRTDATEEKEIFLLPKSANDSLDQKPVKENKKVGFGVFANLDLDALNQRTPTIVQTANQNGSEMKGYGGNMSKNMKNEIVENSDIVSIPVASSSLPDDLYGPELPPNYSGPSHVSPSKSEHKKRAKHKLKHKHKHHKHKSKKKKKRRSSCKSSDDSSIDLDGDIPPALILEKLKKLQKILK